MPLPLRRIRCGILTLAILSSALRAEDGAVSLSGTLLYPDGKPVAGAVVRLNQAGLMDTTDKDGTWQLSGTSLGLTVQARQRAGIGHLAVESGHLRIAFDGRTVTGRRSAPRASVPARTMGAAPRKAMALDTLLFRTVKQACLMMDTIRSAPASGLVHVLDTTFACRLYGSLVDPRDGHRYRTARIGEHVWMVENLNYAASGSTPVQVEADSSAKYGSWYPWSVAMGLPDSCGTKACKSQVSTPHQGACPSGWHVSTASEWQSLLEGADALTWKSTQSTSLLRAESGWYAGRNGDDVAGFRALPAGSYDGTGFWLPRMDAYWWVAGETDSLQAGYRSIQWGEDALVAGFLAKKRGMSLRCVQD